PANEQSDRHGPGPLPRFTDRSPRPRSRRHRQDARYLRDGNQLLGVALLPRGGERNLPAAGGPGCRRHAPSWSAVSKQCRTEVRHYFMSQVIFLLDVMAMESRTVESRTYWFFLTQARGAGHAEARIINPFDFRHFAEASAQVIVFKMLTCTNSVDR